MKNDIGSIIREMRKAAGMSQMKLADKIGISYQQVQKYEKGASKLSVPRLLQLADIFGVPVMSLISDSLDADSKAAATANHLSEDELRAIQYLRKVPTKTRRAMLDILSDISGMHRR